MQILFCKMYSYAANINDFQYPLPNVHGPGLKSQISLGTPQVPSYGFHKKDLAKVPDEKKSSH